MDQQKITESIIYGFRDKVRSEVFHRVEKIPIDLMKPEQHSVFGGLLARQGTLATELAFAVSAWNYHSAPLFIRPMVDVFITVSWIAMDPQVRASQYIEYGLGQAKLQLEHFKQMVKDRGEDPEKDKNIQHLEGWINSQKYTFLLSVDLGSWSGKTTRDMAIEAGIPHVYNYTFSSFSSCVHSTWNHVSRLNTVASKHGLHRNTFVPSMPELPPDIYQLDTAARRFDETTKLYDKHFKIEPSEQNVEGWLDQKLDDINKAKTELEKDN